MRRRSFIKSLAAAPLALLGMKPRAWVGVDYSTDYSGGYTVPAEMVTKLREALDGEYPSTLLGRPVTIDWDMEDPGPIRYDGPRATRVSVEGTGEVLWESPSNDC